jgi:hypothetical protein
VEFELHASFVDAKRPKLKVIISYYREICTGCIPERTPICCGIVVLCGEDDAAADEFAVLTV